MPGSVLPTHTATVIGHVNPRTGEQLPLPAVPAGHLVPHAEQLTEVVGATLHVFDGQVAQTISELVEQTPLPELIPVPAAQTVEQAWQILFAVLELKLEEKKPTAQLLFAEQYKLFPVLKEFDAHGEQTTSAANAHALTRPVPLGHTVLHAIQMRFCVLAFAELDQYCVAVHVVEYAVQTPLSEY